MTRLLAGAGAGLVAVLLPALAAAEEIAPVERRLHADVVTASSFKWNDWNRFQENYLPLYVSDGDPRTTWTEGANGPGVGEWIRMQVTPMDGATRVRLRVRNGYQKSAHLFDANTRPRDVTIKLLPSGTETQVTLTDTMGWQEVVAEQSAGKLEAVEMKTTSVYAGSKWSDQCISDVEVYVTATTKENAPFEKSKLARVKTWRAQRLAAARLFKEGAGEIPLAPGYQKSEAPGANDGKHAECAFRNADDCEIADTLAFAGRLTKDHAEALAYALAAIRGEGTVPVKLVPVNRQELPSIDGMRVPSIIEFAEEMDLEPAELPMIGLVASLQVERLGVLALGAADAPAPACRRKSNYQITTSALRVKSAEGRDAVRALVLEQCGLVADRAGYNDVDIMQVVVYDAAGRIELTVDRDSLTAFTWSTDKDSPKIAAATVVNKHGGGYDLTSELAE